MKLTNKARSQLKGHGQPVVTTNATDKEKAKELFSLGFIEHSMGKKESALKRYEKALEYDHHNPQIWQERGFTLLILKRYNEAISSYTHALEEGQNSQYDWNGAVATLFDMGEAFEALGKYTDAISCYNQVFELDSSAGESLRSQIMQGQRLKNYRGTICVGGKVIR